MDSNTKVRPKLVMLEKAFKLAEMWVDGMSGSPRGDQNELEFIGRPERVGLGARIIPNAKTSSANPVERKLQGALKAIKKKSSESFEKANPIEQNGTSDNEDDDNDEPESRIKALTKKRMQAAVIPQQPTKRIK